MEGYPYSLTLLSFKIWRQHNTVPISNKNQTNKRKKETKKQKKERKREREKDYL